jgi:hypothetical protein
MSTAHHVLPDEAEFARMESELFTRLEHGHARQVRRHRLGAVGVVLVLAGTSIAAVTVASVPAQTNLAYCYSAPSTSSSSNQVATADFAGTSGRATGAASQVHRIANALARCGQAWQTGVFAAPSVNSVRHSIPTLQACIRNDQVIAIFPKKNAATPAAAFCDAVGMSAP